MATFPKYAVRKQLPLLLIDARRKAKLSQTEVATRLKRPQAFVSRYETGQQKLDIADLLEISGVLGIDPLTVLKKLKKLADD